MAFLASKLGLLRSSLLLILQPVLISRQKCRHISELGEGSLRISTGISVILACELTHFISLSPLYLFFYSYPVQLHCSLPNPSQIETIATRSRTNEIFQDVLQTCSCRNCRHVHGRQCHGRHGPHCVSNIGVMSLLYRIVDA